ncbi:MAG: TMEM165/GDT1 family protein [Acidimicrobiales bacterium]
MNLLTALAVLVVIAPSELPDKTFVATVIMSTRYRPALIFAGAFSAFVVQVVIAIAAGGVLTLLPHRAVKGVVTVLFAAGAAYLIFGKEDKQEEEGERMADKAMSGRRMFLTAFGVIFVGEFGDLSQILVANFAAKYNDPVSVFVGAVVALGLISAVAVVSSRAILRVISLSLFRRLAGIILIGFAVFSGYSAITG